MSLLHCTGGWWVVLSVYSLAISPSPLSLPDNKLSDSLIINRTYIV